MIGRSISSEIKSMIGKSPVITITGPRQSGKTTLLKSLFPDWHYFSMETPDIRDQVNNNPRELFARYGHRLILDEVQRTPNIFSYVQTIVDEDPNACFILSGSHNMLMLENISQSLAGRTVIFYLLPLSLEELKSTDIIGVSYEQWIFQGFFPRIYDKDLKPSQFYPSYIETYVQRDVRQIKNIGNLNLFIRFLSICAGHLGQTINYSNLANAAGITLATAKSWLSILETSFIIYQLNPYFRNFNKRIAKSTKLYFYDTGLACSLLRMNHVDAVETYYQKGALFENFIVNEVCKLFYNKGERPPIYYWQDNKNHEIDLLLDLGGKLLPIEIKSGRTYSSEFFKNISWFQKISELPINDSIVIYGGDQDWGSEHGKLISWRNLQELPV